MQVEILYEDNEIVVCIKPKGVLSQQSDNGKLSMINILKEQCKAEIFPIHRLDKDVGGVMLFAKTKAAAAFLSQQVADRSFKKKYIATVHGTLDEKEGVLEDLLFKDSSKNKVFVVKRERRGVKKAKLEYKVLSEESDRTTVSVLLHTGRTHQIRVQFASRKHPIVGDQKYGAKDGEKEIRLRSSEIEFNHPKTKQRMSFSTDVTD